MKNYNETNENTEVSENTTEVSENTNEKTKACSTSFNIWLQVFVKTAIMIFVMTCHAIAFKQCFKALLANDDPTIKVLMGVLMFMIIVSCVILIILTAFVEAFK